MQNRMIYAATAALIVSGTALGQDIPDPNPVPNADGTMTWYVGNNTQFPIVQNVLDACNDGDEIVVVAGQYVESLSIDCNDVTIRPETWSGTSEAAWRRVVFWNPTEGFDNDNGHAMLAGPNTSNTYVGRPREFSQLANGDIVATTVPVSATTGTGADGREWNSNANYTDVCDTAYTNAASVDRLQSGLTAQDELAMVFWSRSIDDVAIRTNDSDATFNYCDISSQNGFGGGILVTGATDATSFVGCTVTRTWSGGQQNDGMPVHAVSIQGGNPMFAGCTVGSSVAGDGNVGGAGGVIAHNGGSANWTGCTIEGNTSPVSDGIYFCDGGSTATFSSCTFQSNTSRFGTIYFDSTGLDSTDYMLVTNCVFDSNDTIDNQYGAVAHCTDAVAGRSPMFVMDRCTLSNTGQDDGTQSGTEWFETDVTSNYFPRYRVLRDVSSGVIAADTENAGVAAGDGSVSGLLGDLNGDNVVNGQDLAVLLGAWGG